MDRIENIQIAKKIRGFEIRALEGYFKGEVKGIYLMGGE